MPEPIATGSISRLDQQLRWYLRVVLGLRVAWSRHLVAGLSMSSLHYQAVQQHLLPSRVLA